MNKHMKEGSLSEIALTLGVNKSKLAYYLELGLLKPISKIGKMNVFDFNKVITIVKNIKLLKDKGVKLKDIKN